MQHLKKKKERKCSHFIRFHYILNDYVKLFLAFIWLPLFLVILREIIKHVSFKQM